VASARSALSVNSTSPTLWGRYVGLVEFTALGLARPSGPGFAWSASSTAHIVKLIIRLRALEDHTLRLPFWLELM
jgi:hypothetical protein